MRSTAELARSLLPASPMVPNEPSFPPSRVVLADDDRATRDVLSAALRADGYDIVEYERGDDLLRGLLEARACECTPALIITDVCMPGHNGLSVLRELRDCAYDVPIVVITASCSEETLNDAIHLGASIVLSKPFSIQDLRRIVECFLPRRPGVPA
jgi:two-component system response regulator MprA